VEGPARRRWHVAPPAEFWAEEYLKALEDGDQAYAAFCAVMGGLAALADKENIAVTRALLGGASDIKNIAKGLKSALAAKKAGKIKTAGGGGRIPGGPVFKTNGQQQRLPRNSASGRSMRGLRAKPSSRMANDTSHAISKVITEVPGKWRTAWKTSH